MSDELPQVLRIVCAYPDGALPGAWFQAVRRTQRTIQRAGYQARLELLPSSAVDGGEAVLITAPAELDGLLDRLVAEGRLQRGPEPPRTIAIHRGFQALGERARLSD